MNLTLNIYDENDENIVKTLKSNTHVIMFGTVVKLMKLLKIEKMEDNLEVLSTIADAWDEITKILSKVFSDATEDDWNHVRMRDVVYIIINIGKFAITDALTIPSDSKN